MKEVKRYAKVGEWIKITNPKFNRGEYHTGDVFKVTFTDGGSVKTDKVSIYIWSSEYVVLEGYEPTPVYPTKVKGNWRIGQAGEDIKKGQLLEYDADTNTVKIARIKKRTWTPEQIQEAINIVFNAMSGVKSIFITVAPLGYRKGSPIIAKLYNMTGETTHREMASAMAWCSENDTYNTTIGYMVAICKLLNYPLPKWIKE